MQPVSLINIVKQALACSFINLVWVSNDFT